MANETTPSPWDNLRTYLDSKMTGSYPGKTGLVKYRIINFSDGVAKVEVFRWDAGTKKLTRYVRHVVLFHGVPVTAEEP